MAKTRMINTRFWDDTFIAECSTEEKLLFLYFLTNPVTSICGVYECPIKRISFDTGIEISRIEKALKKFKGKIYYINGWVYIRNFLKHQNTDSLTVKKGIENGLSVVPQDIRDEIEKIESEKNINIVDLFGDESTQESEQKKKDILTQKRKNIDTVIDEYRNKIDSDIRVTNKSKDKVEKALKEYSLQELVNIIDNFSKNKWWMDNNSGRGLTWFFSGVEQIEKLRKIKPDIREVLRMKQ